MTDHPAARFRVMAVLPWGNGRKQFVDTEAEALELARSWAGPAHPLVTIDAQPVPWSITGPWAMRHFPYENGVVVDKGWRCWRGVGSNAEYVGTGEIAEHFAEAGAL